MYKTISKISQKRLLPRIIAAFAAAFLLLLATGFGIFQLVFGPVTAETTPAESLLGKYVSFDAKDSIAAYASLGSSSSGSTSKQYYVLNWEGNYISVTAGEKYYNLLDAASDQAQEYYLGDLQELSPLGELRGTVVKLEDDLRDYMIKGITGIGIPGADTEEEATAHVVSYTIKLDYVGWLPKTLCIILSCLALVCALYGAALLVLLAKGYYQKDVAALVGESGDAEADFEAASVHDQIRVGKKYTWFFTGAKCQAVKTADIIWGFCESNPLVVSKYQWPMALYTQDKAYHCVHIQTKDEVSQILSEIAAHKYPFVEGYSPAKNKMFQNEYQSFVELAKENKE